MASERGQQASLTPLPSVEELPTLSDGGYDPARVKEAFESFRRHTTQLQVQLRVLQAAGVPPTRGNSVLAQIGCTRKSRNEPSRMALQ